LTVIPHFRTLPSMLSASTRFLAQPRLTMATRTGRRFSSSESGESANTAGIIPAGMGLPAPKTFGPQQIVDASALLDRYRFVLCFQWLAIFRNLNRVAIENANRDMLGAEFHRAVDRGNPAFKRGIFTSFANRDLNVGAFKRANS